MLELCLTLEHHYGSLETTLAAMKAVEKATSALSVKAAKVSFHRGELDGLGRSRTLTRLLTRWTQEQAQAGQYAQYDTAAAPAPLLASAGDAMVVDAAPAEADADKKRKLEEETPVVADSAKRPKTGMRSSLQVVITKTHSDGACRGVCTCNSGGDANRAHAGRDLVSAASCSRGPRAVSDML